MTFCAAMRVADGLVGIADTRASATDVEFPIDVMLYRRDTHVMFERRYERDDLAKTSQWWQQQILEAVRQMPANWVSRAMAGLPSVTHSASDAS